jgi:hypothetical protein
MNVSELKISQNQLEAKIKRLAQKVFGSCSIGMCDFVKSNGVIAEIEVHSLGTTITMFFSDECLNENDEVKSLETFRQTDNLQLCVITNGILKQERVLLFVVEDKEFQLSDVPKLIKGAVGIFSVLPLDRENNVDVKFTHHIDMIVGEILTNEGKRKQIKPINNIMGKLSKSLNGNKTFIYITIERVQSI